MTRLLKSSLAALCVALAPLPRLAAQALDVRVADQASGLVPSGVLLTALDDAGKVVAEATLPASGRRIVTVPGPGRYRIRLRRIGYRPLDDHPVTVTGRDTVEVSLRWNLVAVRLPEIRSTATRCGTRGASPENATLVTMWEQLRTALSLTQVSRLEAFGKPSGSVQRAVTRLARNGRDVLAHTVTAPVPAQARPFGTRTAESFSQLGYVQEEADGNFAFSAPDEAVLLSARFSEEHCFRLERGRGPDAHLVGIGFEPAPERKLADIAGVLWMNRETLELDRLEFWYVDDRLPREAKGRGRAGGEVHFGRGAGGRWIVTAWSLRMPALDRVAALQAQVPERAGLPPRHALRHTGYVESGAMHVPETGLDETPSPALRALRARYTPGEVALELRDSLEAPMAGARVELRQHPATAAVMYDAAPGGATRSNPALAIRSAIADAYGRVIVDSLPAGTYTLLAWGTPADSGGLPAIREVGIESGKRMALAVTAPSFRAIESRCHRDDRSRMGSFADAGIAIGIVRDRNGEPVRHATVRAYWAQRVLDRIEGTGRTDASGAFAICAVPTGQPLRLTVLDAGAPLGATGATPGRGRVVWREIVVPAAPRNP